MISDSARSQNVLSGYCAVDQDNLLGLARASTNHVSGIGAILILDDSAPSLNAVSHDKKSPSVRQADGPTNFNPI